MRFYFLLPLLLWLGIFLSSPLSAAAGPEDDFEAGARAFREQDYRLALYHFSRAEKAGMRDARLDYNLGTVFYRLEEYEASRRYFAKLRGHPTLGAPANYSLGLIAHQLGDRVAAIAWFEKSAEVSDDPALAQLARRQIDKLREQQPAAGFAFVSAAYGHDSNVTLLPSSDASGESGDFLQVLAVAEYALHETGAAGYYLTALLLATDFIDGGEFDDDLLTLGVEYRPRPSDWQLDYGLELGKSRFAGEDYLDTAAITVTARRHFTSNRQLRLGFVIEDVSEGSGAFAFLDGERTELAASYRVDAGPREYRVEYSVETNDRENTANQSFSPTYHRARLRYFDQVDASLKLGASVEFRDGDFDGVATDTRRDQRWRLRLESNYRLDQTWGAQAELTYTDNDSTESDSGYHKHQLQLSVNALF